MKHSCVTYTQGHENKHEDTKTQSITPKSPKGDLLCINKCFCVPNSPFRGLGGTSCLCVFVFKIIFV